MSSVEGRVVGYAVIIPGHWGPRVVSSPWGPFSHVVLGPRRPVRRIFLRPVTSVRRRPVVQRSSSIPRVLARGSRTRSRGSRTGAAGARGNGSTGTAVDRGKGSGPTANWSDPTGWGQRTGARVLLSLNGTISRSSANTKHIISIYRLATLKLATF